MKSLMGLEWVRNQQDTLHCGLVLFRAKFPKDLRRYMQRYMYDHVCVSDKTFARLATNWTTRQQQIYHSMLEKRWSKHYMPPLNGATTVIVGMALALALHGIRVLILVNNRQQQKACMALVDFKYMRYIAWTNPPILKTHHSSELLGFNNGGRVKCGTSAYWWTHFKQAESPTIVFMDNLDMCKLNRGSYAITDTHVVSIIDEK